MGPLTLARAWWQLGAMMAKSNAEKHDKQKATKPDVAAPTLSAASTDKEPSTVPPPLVKAGRVKTPTSEHRSARRAAYSVAATLDGARDIQPKPLESLPLHRPGAAPAPSPDEGDKKQRQTCEVRRCLRRTDAPRILLAQLAQSQPACSTLCRAEERGEDHSRSRVRLVAAWRDEGQEPCREERQAEGHEARHGGADAFRGID